MPPVSLEDGQAWYYGFVISEEQILQAAQALLDQSGRDNQNAFTLTAGGRPKIASLVKRLNIAFQGRRWRSAESIGLQSGTVLENIDQGAVGPRGIFQVFSDIRIHDGILHCKTDWAVAIFANVNFAQAGHTTHSTEDMFASAQKIFSA